MGLGIAMFPRGAFIIACAYLFIARVLSLTLSLFRVITLGVADIVALHALLIFTCQVR